MGKKNLSYSKTEKTGNLPKKHEIITLESKSGQRSDFEILAIGKNDENGFTYIIYTDNSKDENGFVKTLAAKFSSGGDSSQLLPLDRDEDIAAVEHLFDEFENE